MSEFVELYSNEVANNPNEKHIFLDPTITGPKHFPNPGNSSPSNGKPIDNATALKYIRQWKAFTTDLSMFLEKSRIPAKYSDPKSTIHSLREKLLEYELIEFETFSDRTYINAFIAKLKPKESRFRIFKGIKSLQDIADALYGGDLDKAKKEDGVVQYLVQNRKSYISCVIIMVTLNK
ncbi:MAG: hypothetical protein IPG95_15715 [Saprospiraceae bacterium]|nr:hypothetical protein [Saprospiraceae bacterium]